MPGKANTRFENHEFEGMKLSIFGKSVLVTDAMKNYALEKIAKLERLNSHILDIHVTLDVQKIEHHASIVVHFSHFNAKVEAVTMDMYASIDKAFDKLQAALRKWKGKIQDHHKKKISKTEMEVNILERFEDDIPEFNEEISNFQKREFEMPKIIARETKPLKMLTITEAMMKLELSADEFLLFRGEEDAKLRLMYRRNDGNYGLIKAE